MYNLGMGLLGKVFPPLRAKANAARLTGRAVSSFGLNLSGHAELPLQNPA